MKAQHKRTASYILVALVGLALGWLLFGRSTAEQGHDHSTDVAGVTEYTCSMHPQIRQNEPGKCPLCGMDLIPATTGGGGEGSNNPYVLEMTPEAVALSNIQTSVIGSGGGTATSELQLSGTVQLNEQKVSSITAKFPGRIEQLYVNFTGQEVRQGQRLASVYSPELITTQRELQEAAKSRELIPELYEAARTKLRLLGITNAQIQRIESTNELITRFDIYANASGVVTQLMVAVGDYVSTGSALAEVANLSSVWVVFDAYESDLANLREGSNVTFTVAGIPGREFTAKVTFVTPVLSAGTRAVQVRAEVANPGNQLKPGMFANARIRSEAANTATTALTVPRTAVLWTGPRSVVYVKVPGTERPAFEMREVTLGTRLGDGYAVEEGLSAGDEVVTNGVFAVDGAAQLSGNYSMMSTPAATTVETPPAFQEQITALVDQYYVLKNTLVASDAPAASKAAGSFLQALGQVKMGLLSGSTHDKWMELLSPLKANAEAIQKTTALEKQRAAFSPLSDHLIQTVELFGTQHGLAYKQSCPMALGDEGAFWLSEQKEIRNPYFGEAMLTCGDTEKTYRQGQEATQPTGQQPAQQHVH